MFHCYENRAAGTYDVMASVKPWIAEGEPTWAMAAVVPNIEAILDDAWHEYVFGPNVVYANRDYDGVGVFGHMSDLTSADMVWPKLMPVFVAGEGGNDASALVLLMQGHDHDYYTSWGSSYFTDKSHAAWAMIGPADTPSIGPPTTTVTISNGFDSGLTPVPPMTAALFSVTGDADIAVVSLYTGYGRLHDAGYQIDTELDPSAPLALCLKPGGCKCADGSPGASLVTKPAAAPLSIGVDGGNMTAQVGLLGEPLDKFCEKPQDPPPPALPNGGGGGGGGGATPSDPSPPPAPSDGDSWGDPHIETFDGAHVEFQRIGEYTLARSTKDDFVVQVRQVPVGSGRWASVNKAVATRIGGHRVTVTFDNSGDVLRIDGAVVSADPPAMTGGTIARAFTAFGTNYTFEWPDGTVLHADQLGRYAINVRLVPSPARRGALEGLLGNDDGKPENDETAVPALADTWLVSQSASLFDYAPGQSSKTFIDPSFPNPGDGVADRAAAERDCREEGITDSQLLQDCIVDFGITNGFLFRTQYAHQQAVLSARAALRPAGVGAADRRTLLMDGRITDPHSVPVLSFVARAGDVIYIPQTSDCVDRASDWWNGHTNEVVWLSLFDPAGHRVGNSRPGCEMGRFVLPVAGTYLMKANVAGNQTGPYHVPIHFVRPDRVKAVGYGAILSGTIEQPGAHDVYTFTARAGDLIQIAGQGCQLSGIAISAIRPDGADIMGPGCNQGSVLKIGEDGDYKFVVNYSNTGSGPYQFVFQGVSGGAASR